MRRTKQRGRRARDDPHFLFLTTSFAPIFVPWLRSPSARSGPREHETFTSASKLGNAYPRITAFHMVKLWHRLEGSRRLGIEFRSSPAPEPALDPPA